MRQKKFHINWPRVLLIVLLFCIICLLIYGAMFYRTIENTRTDRFDEAKDYVLEQSPIKNITHISHFQDVEGFFTFLGENKENEVMYVFLRDDEQFTKEQLYIIPENKVTKADEIKQIWAAECADCTLVRLTPAMVEQFPLWEVTYIDESNRYVIEYKYLENGKTYETIRLTRKSKKD